MTKLRLTKVVSFLILTSILLAAFVVPQQAVQAAQSNLVRFTFSNKSDKMASLRLYGTNNFYYFLLKPGETKTYTPVRGEYKMSFFSCGQYVNQSLDLTKQTKLIVPPCGTKAFSGKNPPANVVDGGKVLKLVKVKLENKTGAYMKVILSGPASYVFTFNKDQAKTYTITKGEYNYTVYGCGGSFTGTFYASANKIKEFKCP